MMDLNQFQSWQQEKPESRYVKIEIDNSKTTVFVFDTDLHEGQLVTSVDEIDLEGRAEEKERQTLAELQAKYGEKIAV